MDSCSAEPQGGFLGYGLQFATWNFHRADFGARAVLGQIVAEWHSAFAIGHATCGDGISVAFVVRETGCHRQIS